MACRELGACSHVRSREVTRARASRSRLDEVTASVLVRRGLADPDEARRFLDGRAARARSVRARRHARSGRDVRRGDRGRARASACTATTTPTASAQPRWRCLLAAASSAPRSPWHLPSRFEEGYGLNGQTLDRLAEEGFDLVAHRRLRHHRGRRGRARAFARARGRRHRPSPAGRVVPRTARSSRR